MLIKVLIADDHPIICSGIRNELAHHADMEVVGEAHSGDEALQMSKKLKPDVVLLDLKMPGMKTTEVLSALRDMDNGPKALVLSAFCDPENVQGILRSGARGYLIKDTDPTEIVKGIRKVAEGKTWLSAKVIDVLMESMEDEWHCVEISPRQLQVLQLLGKGYSNQRIAEELGIKERMVRYHLDYLMSKLGASNKVELVLSGIKRGWFKP